MKHYFKTVRDVTRYINTLKFSFEMVRNDVNPVDFVAITTLQVFEPEIYTGIRDNKDLFSGTIGDGLRPHDAEIKQATQRCNEILARTETLEVEEIKEFLSLIFPSLKTIYGNMHYGSGSLETWQKESRICHPDIFDIYFQLSIPEGNIRKSEIISILDLANDKEAFSQALMKLRDDGRILRFLEVMEAYTKEFISKENIQNIISVLMNIGDSFPESELGMFEIDTPMKVLRLMYQLSQRFEGQDERFNIFKQAIIDAEESLYTIVEEVGVHGQHHGKRSSKSDEALEPEDKRPVNAEQLIELEKLACRKIQLWASDGRLRKHSRLISILYSWRHWCENGNEEVSSFINNLIQTDEGLIELINAFVYKSYSQGMEDYVARVKWKINLETVKDFIPIEQLEPRARKIVVDKSFNELSGECQRSLKVFIDTIDGKIESW